MLHFIPNYLPPQCCSYLIRPLLYICQSCSFVNYVTFVSSWFMQCRNQLLSSLVNSNCLAYRYRVNSLCIKLYCRCPAACLQKTFWNTRRRCKPGWLMRVTSGTLLRAALVFQHAASPRGQQQTSTAVFGFQYEFNCSIFLLRCHLFCTTCGMK